MLPANHYQRPAQQEICKKRDIFLRLLLVYNLTEAFLMLCQGGTMMNTMKTAAN